MDSIIRDSIINSGIRLGYPVMKPEQLEVAASFVQGRDVFAVLPTGFGKSLCYACLPTAFDVLCKKEKGYSIVVVVTPLLAIMKDQLTTYTSKGLSSVYVPGESGDHDDNEKKIAQGNFQLIFFTPEMLVASKKWRRVIEGDVFTTRLKALIIDEAHCVKKWGNTFRRVMKRIGEIRSLVPSHVNVMALTATATRSDRITISRTLGLKNPFVLAKCPAKPNLVYHVVNFTTLVDSFKPFTDKLVNEMTLFPKTIVYCHSIRCVLSYIYF